MVDEGYSLSNTFLRLLGKHYDTTHVVVGHWSFEKFERLSCGGFICLQNILWKLISLS